MTHKCPGPRCYAEVDSSELMCPSHWRQVPKPIRRAVWIAWNRSAGAGTPAHTTAIRLAVAAVNRDVVPASSIKHPARGFALVSTPRAGLVSPAMTRRSCTDEHYQ
jgi:hypothetical protein